MPKYDSEAKKIIAQINREAKRRYASGGYTKAEKAKIKSAYQTGRVESNFTNSSRMTDHDSQGWRQERASLYKDPTNLRRSVRRYFDEADQMYRPGMRSYQVAADVQRPAAQYRHRYGLHQKEAESLFKQLRGGSGGATGMTPAAEAPSPTGRAGALRELLKASVQNPGAETALTGKNIAQAFIAEATGETGATSEAPAKEPEPKLKKSGRQNPWTIPKKYGLTVTSGYRPGAITSAGNVSDHTGKPGSGTLARDYGGSMEAMDKAARQIAKALGIKNYKPGSIVNVNRGGYRYQLIWKTADHMDHAHLGRKKL